MNTVLLIEDNLMNRDLVRNHLERIGIALVLLEAENGLSGLDMALKTPPNLVFLDSNLPDINGFEVLRRLRGDARTAKLRVVALTADTMASNRAHCLNAGFDAYLSKPIMRLELTY